MFMKVLPENARIAILCFELARYMERNLNLLVSSRLFRDMDCKHTYSKTLRVL